MEEKAEILENVLHQYITGVATHFRGKVAAWDVVNEPMNDNGTLRSGEENLQATDVFYWQCKLIRQEAVLKVGLNAKDAKKPQRTQSLYR
jgi:GH35 family endo-1,4-beta-xylanase